MSAPTPGQRAHARWHEVRWPESTPQARAKEWEILSAKAKAAWEAAAEAGFLASLAAVQDEVNRLAAALDEASLKLGKVRELAESWTEADGWGDLTREMKTEAECARQVLAVTEGTQSTGGTP